ncbi:MAG TPA: hypothetical protein VJJ76_03795 [archaeon]|nr:hypothetical protein [archaeon]
MLARNKNKFALFGILLFSSLFSTAIFSNAAMAHCPLCTLATGAAVATARWYGVDDLIVSTFIGGTIISTGYWMNNWLNRRSNGKGYLKFQLPILILFSYVTVILSLYFTGFLGNTSAQFTLFGIDKLFIGATIGSIATIVAFTLHDALRKQNGNKNYLPFQAIVLAFVLLTASVGFFYTAGWIIL